MTNFKLYFKRALCLFLLVLGITVIYHGLDFVISDDTGAQTRVTFHDYYEQDHIDYLFVGPSHTIRMINAVQLTEDLGKNVYNLSSSSMDFRTAYYVIKDAIEAGKTDNIFFEVSLSRLKVDVPNSTALYIVADYLKSPLNRSALLLKTVDSDRYINSFFRLRRNIDPLKLPTMESMNSLYERKHRESYTQYLGNADYLGKGQWSFEGQIGYRDTITVNYNSNSLDNFVVEDMTDTAWTYLRKIIELCQKKNVPLTLFMTPYTEVFIDHFRQYETITDMVYKTAEEYGVPLVDLNLVDSKYMDLKPGDFNNMDHLNSSAGDKVSAFFAQYIGDPSIDYYGYHSIREKYPVSDKVIAAAYARFFQMENGEEVTHDYNAGGEIETMRIDISAYSHHDIPAKARVWLQNHEEGSDQWSDAEEIMGEQIDEYTTEFILPYNYDHFASYYRIQLLNPEDGTELYEAFTRFDMD